jgi:transcription elongation factor GreA
MNKFKITQEGFNKIETELKNYIENERPSIIEAIVSARELGDLKENEEYHTSKEKQRFIDAQIQKLSEILANAEVVDIKRYKGSDKINFGAKVKLLNLANNRELKYQLLSEHESDIDNGKIAMESPIGMALIDKEVGDEVKVGKNEFKVVEVKY